METKSYMSEEARELHEFAMELAAMSVKIAEIYRRHNSGRGDCIDDSEGYSQIQGNIDEAIRNTFHEAADVMANDAIAG